MKIPHDKEESSSYRNNLHLAKKKIVMNQLEFGLSFYVAVILWATPCNKNGATTLNNADTNKERHKDDRDEVVFPNKIKCTLMAKNIFKRSFDKRKRTLVHSSHDSYITCQLDESHIKRPLM